MTKVVNLVAGPGAGKSTTAAGLFFLMKSAGWKAELVTEYAKELAYEGTLAEANQYRILLEQDRRLRRLVGKVDWIITDSPLFVGSVYCPAAPAWLHEVIRDTFAEYDNINVLVERSKPYQAYGRVQDELQARQFDGAMRSFMAREGLVKHEHVQGTPQAPATLFAILEHRYADIPAPRA